MTLTPINQIKVHHWTEADNDLMRMYYDGSSKAIETLGHLIGAGREAVKQRATILHLTRSQDRHNWTPDEIERLQKLTPFYSPKTISKMIGVTENSIYNKQRRLKISSILNRDWLSLDEVKDVFAVTDRTVHHWIDSDKLKASRYRDGNTKVGIIQITPKALRDFITAYPIELQGRKVDMVFLVDLLANYRANGKA